VLVFVHGTVGEAWVGVPTVRLAVRLGNATSRNSEPYGSKYTVCWYDQRVCAWPMSPFYATIQFDVCYCRVAVFWVTDSPSWGAGGAFASAGGRRRLRDLNNLTLRSSFGDILAAAQARLRSLIQT
jgi:hypothetical protein